MQPQFPSSETIGRCLERFLTAAHVRNVYFAESSVPPPVLAYVTHFPRLYIPLSGIQVMEIAQNAAPATIRPGRGDAVFVPGNAWDKPAWQQKVRVLTFLFGAKHLGISLVEHDGRTEAPARAIKTNLHGAYDGLTQGILRVLIDVASVDPDSRLARLIVESLLHSCRGLLKSSPRGQTRKAVRTFESICLYMQENFRSELSRESVAEHFRLSPNHVSRLFRQEGHAGFHDYLNIVRVNRAKFMLKNYNVTLKEVAANCGYADVAYFCRIFKKATSLTPTKYRQGRD